MLLWKRASRHFSVIRSALFFIGAAGCFFQHQDRCYSSPRSQSAQGSEVTAITALQRDAFLNRKLPQRVFGAFYSVASSKGLLKPEFCFFSAATMAPILLNCLGNEHKDYIQ